MFKKRIILVFFIILSLLGGASSAFAAKDYNIKNDTESFFFINGNSGNVGVGTTVPVGQFDIQAGSTAPAKITTINGVFADLATTKTGLYIDVNASVAGTSGATGSWSEIRVTANAGTYTNAIAGVYGEVLHSGSATADFLMGSVSLVNQMGSGTITHAYGLYPQIWKGAGVINHAYGMYYQGVPNLNGDTGTDLGGSVVDQYGIGIRKLTEATTRNIALLIDDTTEGSTTAGNYSIYEESGYPSYFTGNIGIGTLNPEAKLALHSTGTTLVDSHMNEDTTGTNTIESHYAVGKSGQARTTPSDVQNFRFFFGGFDQEVGRISMNTPSMSGATAIGAMDIYTQGAAGTLVRRMTLDEHKAMFATNVGIGTTVPLALLQVGVNPGIPAGSLPAQAVKGNLVVDGRIYGDGSGLTGISGAITGLNATRVPVASGPTTIVDSGIYYVGVNVGIGSATPVAKLDVDSVIYAHGNIGIGTSVPMDKLDILNGNIVFSGPDNGVQKSILWRSADGAVTGGFVRADPGYSSIPMEIGDFGGVQIFIDTNNNDTNRYFSIHNNVATGTTNELFRVQEDGNVGIGTAVPRALLEVGTTAAIPSGSSPAGIVRGNFVVDGKIYGDGSGLTGVSSISGLTDNYIPRANGANAIENSIIYDSGTNIGIGSAAPVAKLDVDGTVYFHGNVGIGTPTATLARLQVTGPAKFGSINAAPSIGYDPSETYTGLWQIISSDIHGDQTMGSNLAVKSDRLLYTLNNHGSMTGAAISFGGNGHPNGTNSINFFAQVPGAATAGTTISMSQAVMSIQGGGNVGMGTVFPVAKLHVGGGGSAPNAMPVAGGDDVYIAGNLEVDGRIYGDGAGITGISGAISGLNTGYIPRASTSSTIVDSTIYQNVSNVGIGTTVPVKKLEVKGGDVYINQVSSQLVMKKPDGTCATCGPNNSDIWVCTGITCP